MGVIRGGGGSVPRWVGVFWHAAEGDTGTGVQFRLCVASAFGGAMDWESGM